ncbi:zinc finger CCCH domain-containing protein 24-like [Phoenix dactylifera]|uniref:Zinc finger CCCH domain-containing protein 24-like n=1 Tax=Phoenix dactylifera TaxID=42345 RepID=A0A8B7BJ67_PHODC|nr:zinc finger CCCH domain-containing protein 24-like [Phoenix dactylifera]
MCGGPERLKHSPSPSPSPSTSPSLFTSEQRSSSSPSVDMNHLTLETDDNFSSLLELVADNDADGLRRAVDEYPSAVDEIGLWYGRKKGSNRMVLEPRTPLMVAATYGSIEVLQLILSSSSVDVNRCCGPDKTTALHCAASGGSANAVDAVKLLLSAGADASLVDANGHRPADVIAVPPKLVEVKLALEELLGSPSGGNRRFLRLSTSTSSFSSPPLSLSPDEDGSPSSDSSASPTAGKFHDHLPASVASEKKEYPVDPSMPDIKNSIYATDEFRMFSFKVRPCSRAYSHDWTECPFVHPGENARRRDPRKYHYSCVPCPDFRKGACRRGDLCEYAHGVFECWLHPAQYRTRLCKDGTSCTRRVCFFAHTNEELRPLYVSTGSAVPSPRSSASAAMEMAAAMSLLPGSPSSVSVMSPTPFTPPMSPSANGGGHSSLAWPQPNVPALHLPGSNLQSSRLRTSLSARDMPADEFSVLPELEAAQQQLSDFCFSPSQSRLGSSLAGNRPVRSTTLASSNLDDLFSAEISSSPRYNSDQGGVFSPSHKSAVLNPFQQQQQQSLLSPVNTNSVFSPKAVDPQQQLSGHSTLLQASLGVSSPGRMSPRNMEPLSPMSSRLAALAHREKLQQQLRSLSSRDLSSNNGVPSMVGLPGNSSWSNWGSPSGKVDWGVDGAELGRYKRSASFELGSGGEEPDVSWVQSLVSPPEAKEEHETNTLGSNGGGGASDGSNNSNNQLDGSDHTVLGAWLEQKQLDQLVA